MKDAVVIGITTGRGVVDGNETIRLGEAYVQAVLRAGGIPLLLPPVGKLPLEAVLPRLDGLLLTGGGDIDPVLFDGRRHPSIYGIDAERDELEIALVRAAVRQGLPFLAICRGIQVVNVALGGTLYTDIADQLPGALAHPWQAGAPRDRLVHPVKVEADSRLAEMLGASGQVQVNSLHHQGIQRLAAGLRSTATAPDGLIEAVEATTSPFGLAVQWHPECLPALAPMQALFQGLVTAARANHKSKD
jgi:putative glutamine amidotransferase